MKWVGVMPFIYQPYRDACVKTMHPDFKKHVLEIDNTKKNLGIMKSHNLGVERMRDERADWLVVISAAVRFGKSGGLDFIEQLDRHPEYHVAHGDSGNLDDKGQRVPYGWHLVAFRREVIENVGDWDTNFSKYGLDDIDLSLRIQKFYGDRLKWDKFPCDVSDTTSAHSVQLAGVKSAYPPRNEYFKRKWNRDGGEWDKPAFDHPFNDPTKPLSWYPSKEHPLSIHQVEFKLGEWTYED